jgi:PPP family 3-phenylpropionic acid transporter
MACLAWTAISASALAPLGPSETTAQTTPSSAWVLLRDRSFLVVVLATSLIQASHAVYYGFSTIDWRAAGFSGTTIGALWATAVVAEIVLFAASARLPGAIEPITFLLIGAAGAVVRWGAMALDPPGALLPFLQCLHALSFAATHLGSLAYVARAAPAGLGATAQGYLSVSLGLVIAGATSTAGFLYARYGDGAYAAMALTACAGGLCALVARRLRR